MSPDLPITFVSYDRDDQEFARQLVGDLKKEGINAWMDQEQLVPGQRWDTEIQQILKACRDLVVILSPSSVNSDSVLDEFSFALNKEKIVIPILYIDCEVPFRLDRLERVDFTEDYARGLHRLLRALGKW